MGLPAAPLPFIGRDRELSAMRTLLAQARTGPGLAVAVTGEPGIGKTRLCEEVLSVAQSQGFLVCRTKGHPLLTGVPLAMMSGLLRSAFEQLTATEQASITSGLRGLGSITSLGPGQDNPDFGEAAVFDAVTEFCRRLSSRRPVVAYIDSFEWADEPSVRLTAAVVGQLARQPLLLLVSTRRATAASQRTFAADLARTGQTLNLERLTQESSEALVRMVRPELKVPHRRALAIAAGGLPIYLAGVLRGPDGTGSFDPPQVMGDQLDTLWIRLSAPAQEMTRHLAVAGGTVPEHTLLQFWSEVEGFSRALREVVDAEVAVVDPAGIRLSHPAYGRILAGRMFEHERREHHRRFAAVLEAAAQPASLPALADHLLEIADETDPETLRKALTGAAAAPHISDERLCRYLEHLLALLPPKAEPQLRYQLYSRLGAAQQRLGKPELARASWNRALDDGLNNISPATHFGGAETQLAFQEWETAWATEDDSGRYDQLRASLYRLIWTTRYGSRKQNLEAAQAAVSLGNTIPSGTWLAELGYCFVAWASGRFDDARQHALKGFSTVQGDDVGSIAMITLSRIAPLAGDLKSSLEAVTALADTAATYGLSYGECAARSWAALFHHLAGNLPAAEEQLRPAVTLAAESGAAPVIARICLLTALLQAERGDLKAATASLADAQRVRGTSVWQADLEGLKVLVQGMVALQAGKPEQVPREPELTPGNYPVLTLMPPFLSGLAGLQAGDKDRTRACLEMLDVDPVQGPPVHALGARLRGLELVSSGKAAEGSGMLKEAADILEGCGLTLYSSQARLEWAEAVEPKDTAFKIVPVLLHYFEEQNVGWWLQRTRRLARLMGYVQDHPHRNGHTLSPREAEVVLKASMGLSNATIAEQLFLSERTIESHLRNVYKRLGLSSRVSLAAWATENPGEFSTATDTARSWPG